MPLGFLHDRPPVRSCEEQALNKGMEQKAAEFRQAAAEVYRKA